MHGKVFGIGIAVSAALAASAAFADDDAWFQPGKYDGRTVNIVVNASQLQPPFAPILTALHPKRLGLGIGDRHHRRDRREAERSRKTHEREGLPT